MEPKLTIVTLALAERRVMRKRLEEQLAAQIGQQPVEHLVLEDNGELKYGEKLRRAYRQARGEYVCCVDDDDVVSEDYVTEMLAALVGKPDVVTFRVYREDINEQWCLRANALEDHVQENDYYVMTANHLCAWRTDLARSIPWYPAQYSIEVLWYRMMCAAFPNLAEAHIPKIIYYYNYDPTITRAQDPASVAASMNKFEGGMDAWRHKQTAEILISKLGRSYQNSCSSKLEVIDQHGNIRRILKSLLEPLIHVVLR